jgi:hypothetical protein
MNGGWIVEVDIRKFFDTVDHAHLREILRRRIGDGVLLRLIGKWLNAGVIEGLELSYSDEGTPQGGVISPLLANIYLHDVLDEWFVRDVQPVLADQAEMFRFADDFVVLFASKLDAERFLAVLPKRFGKYGLTLHPDKTRMVAFQRPDRVDDDDDGPGTFNFLGFTHYWGLSRKPAPKGKPPVTRWFAMQKTAKDRLSRALRQLSEWCRWHRHDRWRRSTSLLRACPGLLRGQTNLAEGGRRSRVVRINVCRGPRCRGSWSATRFRRRVSLTGTEPSNLFTEEPDAWKSARPDL